MKRRVMRFCGRSCTQWDSAAPMSIRWCGIRHRICRIGHQLVDYRCRACGRVFNAFTGTLWQQTRYRCSRIVLILRGIAQGTPTAHLARKLGIDRGTLLDYRHHVQAQLVAAFPPEALQDLQAEADEMYTSQGRNRWG